MMWIDLSGTTIEGIGKYVLTWKLKQEAKQGEETIEQFHPGGP
jgi:hypothetical protein